jgi:hypothetical protein
MFKGTKVFLIDFWLNLRPLMTCSTQKTIAVVVLINITKQQLPNEKKTKTPNREARITALCRNYGAFPVCLSS